MGRRWCHHYTTRIMACLGTLACSTKDQARSASDDISQSTNSEAPQWLYAEALQILVPRRQWVQSYPQPQFASNGPGWGGEGYPMQAYPPPGKTQDYASRSIANCIAYNTDHVPPPVYQPPDSGSKTNPHEDWAAVPPPGPPPGHQAEGHQAEGHQAGEPSRTMETVPLNQDESRQDNTSAQPHVHTETSRRLSRLNPFN